MKPYASSFSLCKVKVTRVSREDFIKEVAFHLTFGGQDFEK